MKLKIKKLHDNAVLPKYATAGAACFDLHAVGVKVPTPIYHKNPEVFRTGLAFEVPEGWVMLVFSRSGNGFKNDTRLSNCEGVIDSDYRGEVMVKLARDCSPSAPMIVKDGDRIAQAMLVRVEQWEFELAEELSSTERGDGGFGSTGQ